MNEAVTKAEQGPTWMSKTVSVGPNQKQLCHIIVSSFKAIASTAMHCDFVSYRHSHDHWQE
jgi:hypothetical protein